MSLGSGYVEWMPPRAPLSLLTQRGSGTPRGKRGQEALPSERPQHEKWLALSGRESEQCGDSTGKTGGW